MHHRSVLLLLLIVSTAGLVRHAIVQDLTASSNVDEVLRVLAELQSVDRFGTVPLRPRPNVGAASLVPSVLQPLLAFLSRGLGGALEAYNGSMRNSPLRTKALTSCAVALLGEVVGAFLSARASAGVVPVSRHPPSSSSSLSPSSWLQLLNARRLVVFGAYGLVITGEEAYPWALYLYPNRVCLFVTCGQGRSSTGGTASWRA